MKNLKILVVDDEKVVRDFLLKLLSMEAEEVKTVENGFQAIEAVKGNKFDFIFLDIRMPEIDGVELLGELKKISPDTKYVMMTGYAVDDLIEKAKQIGIYASIRKPFDINQILSFVKTPVTAQSKNAVNVLIIDDDKSVLDFFKKLLKDQIYEVTCLEKGKEAFDLVSRRDFDIIFLDMVLKDMSGVELYLKIQETKPSINVILITGYADKTADIERMGIKNFIYKPFDINRILSEVEKVTKLKQGK
ncbi:MAG: response regulator [Candidatus Omnitrophica bacterium]|nr:response regulator [Candidatus Omnitrophota bacterium]